MLKAKISYPQKQEERDIMRMNLAGEGLPKVNKVTSPEDIVKARRVVEEVYMDEKIENTSSTSSSLPANRPNTTSKNCSPDRLRRLAPCVDLAGQGARAYASSAAGVT